MERGNQKSRTRPVSTQIPPVTEIHNKARSRAGMAAGLSGSVAVSSCRLTTDRVTNKIIIPASIPTPKSNFVFIFMIYRSF